MDLLGVTCGACNHKVTKEEASAYERYEKALKTLTDNFEVAARGAGSNMRNDARELEEFADAIFSQHWMADIVMEQLIEYYEKLDQPLEQFRLHQRRCAFHAAAYPGLSPSRAWALESMGDFLCRAGRSEGVAGPGRSKLDDALVAYRKASEILRLAYGDDYESTVLVYEKMREVQQDLGVKELKKASNAEEVSPHVHDKPPSKRRRLSGKQSCSASEGER